METSTCGFAVTQVLPVNGFQNGGDYITLAGAGFATGLRAYIADGRAPVRVLDASHALVQTPPGPVGARDVKIVLGGLSATTPQAFEYVAAGLDMVWAQKPMMQVRGEDPGIGVAMDGRVLVAGGTTVPDNPALSLASAELYERAIADSVREVVIATNSTTTGEATALHIADGLRERVPGLTVTRLASGLPVGSDLEYADEVTLGRAFAGRRAV